MTMTRQEAEQKIIERAWQDDSFRAQLVGNPKAAIEAELGFSLPAGTSIEVLEEDASTQYLVIPQSAGATGELADGDLEDVEGGICWNTCDNVSCGVNSGA